MTGPAKEAIGRLLNPRSVAIVGASPTPGALGANVLASLERLNFPGEIHLINPKRDEIGGRPCLRSVDDLPPGVDAAVLAIPRAADVSAATTVTGVEMTRAHGHASTRKTSAR